MDPFLNGTGKTGTGQVSFTRKNVSEPFHFLSEPFHFFRSCKRAFSVVIVMLMVIFRGIAPDRATERAWQIVWLLSAT